MSKLTPSMSTIVADYGALRDHGTARSGQDTYEIRVASSGMGQRRSSTIARRATASAVLVAALAVVTSGCGILGGGAPLDSISVSSSRIKEGAPLPAGYSCKGTLGSPPLRWSGVPTPQTKSVAVVVDNNGAGFDGEMHWVLYNIDPRTTELGDNIAQSLPAGMGQLRLANGKVGYSPPCRADGNYRFTVYALDRKVEIKENAPLSDALQRIAERTIARGRLTAVHIE
ncbi:YbhB/YbcL family Raf kinase inhibitor-like protein [Spongiactinospora sp. TRM90649]|uniref:YbhB/YbcL family Raf kinase inhibitor-like protein n=1 Tax=Spongiactinospora sp. TRM90649 TaxID=3031114 RepID=UPI0023F6BB19|nr:YbhB/YbcL family Raf kinase inhibitor-like protein [Spongiactinospora sp. TRM90649]MDF5757966.1 YbhB/YbcL family Raf kinase inhibitor-like protein [Spongiactinospora sp. TRM90649]